ncbi:MAG: sigma-54 dependent transcriptional regulator [Rhodospirillales bacterium]|nr:sigma-54 dependent transcriptional regulator [Rhodospirillales bacterium]
MAYDILIVDDESDIRVLTAGVLEDEGFLTREAADSTSALAEIRTRRPSMVLLDIWLQNSELDGLGILEAAKKEYPDLPVVMMSGHGTVETAVLALKLGAYDFIEKPFTADRLLLITERAIEASELRRQNLELRQLAGSETELIGESPSINHIRQTIERVGPSNSRVLISGPAGSGKELVARAIHAESHRADGPFIVLNCATMQPDRMEIELFGTESSEPNSPGARRIGIFESAHNGTLFFDEVADMPLETQGKIVRVLQEQNFRRVGGKISIQVDVRVISATSHDLAKKINENSFREDLFYRLNVVPVQVPSLSERREDIPLLANYFMAREALAAGRQPRTLGQDTIAALQGYDWPGNGRELRNFIERLLITAPGEIHDPITVDMLTANRNSQISNEGRNFNNGAIMGLPLREAREIFEKEYLLGQVDRFGGNISRTASFIGMERSALHRKLKSLGVQKDDKPSKTGNNTA